MTYDLFVSLGGNCGAASQLKMRGLRTCALPFDWLFMGGPETIDYLAEGFADGFRNFCLKENLRPFSSPETEHGTAEFCYQDTYTGYRFIHHFHRPITETGAYEAVYGQFERRFRRLLDCLNSGKRVLFVLATPFAYDPQKAVALLNSLRALFPKATMDMACLQFGVSFDNPLVTSERWPEELPFVAGGRYAHPQDEYAYERTGYEWSFLDKMTSAISVRRMSGWSKKMFKCWKWLSKKLYDQGYGCRGIRFPRNP